MGFRCRRMLYIAHGQARPGQARAFEAVEVNLEHDILLVEAVLAPSRVAGQPHLVRALAMLVQPLEYHTTHQTESQTNMSDQANDGPEVY